MAATAVTAGWAALYVIADWTVRYVSKPIHDDVRFNYVAAEAGIHYGWPTIYDQTVLRLLSAGFPTDARVIDVDRTFVSTPLIAWLLTPLTVFSEPVAYGIWTLLSLGLLVYAWYIAAPYAGLAKFTLLLAALALWPVLSVLYYGQPTLILIGLLAISWLSCAKDRPLSAGVALALATFLKPQAVLLLPAALIVSGRYRVTASWAVGSLALAMATAITLGPSGLVAWWHAVRGVQGVPLHFQATLAGPIGMEPLTYVLWGLQGATALLVAWWRRDDLAIVFAAGILGTAMTASYFHAGDYSILVLAAWLVLRTAPSLWHRIWLLIGIVPMQLVTLGPAAPQLIWDAVWLGILVAGCVLGRSPTPNSSLRPIRELGVETAGSRYFIHRHDR
jgi:hypothetical protein